jgi:hypothetical protein
MYPWEQVKQAVERSEDLRLDYSLAEEEVRAGHVARGYYLVQRTRPYLEVIGALVVGIHAGVMTLVFNFLLFVWIMHINFAY